MPLSLKCMIDKLEHKGQISEEEHKQILDKLKGHDKQVRADGARKFAEWLSNTEYVTNNNSFILPLKGKFTIDEVVSEWEKEK